MTKRKSTTPESVESWLSSKPFWEQYVWKLNLEKDSLTDEDIEKCYEYLCEHLKLIDKLDEEKPAISFKNVMGSIQDSPAPADKLALVEIKDIADVNALSPDCCPKFGPNLTLIFGVNGSGKSGLGRLLCNACFSRGDRDILPNVRQAAPGSTEPKATFVVRDAPESTREINYSFGDNIDDLKRFSVFDSESVLIHLDRSNQVNFIPAQIQIFDKVAKTIDELAHMLNDEMNSRRKDNPFQSMFLDGVDSETAEFCRTISGATNKDDFLKLANFNDETDEPAMEALQKKIDAKKKLDIPKKKAQLATDRRNLQVLKTSLQNVIDNFTEDQSKEINKLVADILEKKKIIQGLSVSTFDDGLFKTIGSPEWRALISAAKDLYEQEKAANEDKEPEHCLLCHQELSEDAKSLFKKYWEYLESKAEGELRQLTIRKDALLQNLQSLKTTFPKFQDTDAGIKVLQDEDSTYLEQLKGEFKTLESILDDWITNIKQLNAVSRSEDPEIDLDKIDTINTLKTDEEAKLVDPTDEIAKLTDQQNELKHKKEVTAVKTAALEYIAFLNWKSKADRVNFSGIKQATTRKRTESFAVVVAKNYESVFNDELVKLNCDFNLMMKTSGAQGSTVKEFRLDFAQRYSPSQILSEGEQNACSLADFLTEAQLDNSNCGIIFDDPVSSLDHERKEKIAKRLVEEAANRQVIVLTHDLLFMSQLAKHTCNLGVPAVSHWMQKVKGVPGCVTENSSPKLANLASLKKEAEEAVKESESLGAKELENALGTALDYLRSACEALIEETLFAGTIRRYEDHIRVTCLEEAIYDRDFGLKIAELHGRISEMIPGHNRSDVQREAPLTIDDFNGVFNDFCKLEVDIKAERKKAIKERDNRKKDKPEKKLGW